MFPFVVLAGGDTQLGGQVRQWGLSDMHHYFQISSFLLTCPKLWPIQRNNACRGDTSSIALSPFVMALPDPFLFFFFFSPGLETQPRDLCDRVD